MLRAKMPLQDHRKFLSFFVLFLRSIVVGERKKGSKRSQREGGEIVASSRTDSYLVFLAGRLPFEEPKHNVGPRRASSTEEDLGGSS